MPLSGMTLSTKVEQPELESHHSPASSIKIYEEILLNFSTSHKKIRVISVTTLKQIMLHCLKCSMRKKKHDFI